MTPFPRRPFADDERDRAQLILVSALVLATTLVALSLVVNSVIYTENLATRRDADTGQALNFREATHDGALRGLETANFEPADATYLQRKAALRDTLASWQTDSSRYFASQGLEVATSAASFVEGTRVSQDTVGPFVPADSNVVYDSNTLDLLGLGEAETWVAANATSVRRLRLSVERNDRLYETSQSLLAEGIDTILTGNEVYALYVEDSNGDDYRIYVYENTTVSPNEVSVAVYDEQATDLVGEACRVPGDTVDIDVTGGTLTGSAGTESCEALSFWQDTDGPYDLYHLNGNSVEGTYSFVTDRPEVEFREAVEDQNQGLYDDLVDLLGMMSVTKTDPVDDETYATSDGSTVYTTPAIYATDVTVEYRTGGLVYESSVRVAPGEPGEPTVPAGGAGGGDSGSDSNTAPDAQFSVSDTSVTVGNAVSFDASASSDSDGSVDSYEWAFGDGNVDTGTTPSHAFGSTGSYDVTLTVTDDDGATDSRTRTVEVVSSSADAPTIDSLSVTDGSTAGPGNSPDDVSFTADWTVSDADDNLLQVRVELVEDPDGAAGTLDTDSASISGGSAASALNVGGTLRGGCGDPYDVVVTVEDGDGQTDSRTERVSASC
ncbi:PKD domain-containing protein [Salinirubellus salinus]|uniref:PKD domain-containing protein n=1 Tax=Salinirubellus salinus TaxID=1364945 RepID=A0A9E7U5A2_9EURY|nr:PKD domain-containing protein [Salinirubellus salinus]UWM55185.1 PKD domain-containing protein [Salinirubellus salinus]